MTWLSKQWQNDEVSPLCFRCAAHDPPAHLPSCICYPELIRQPRLLLLSSDQDKALIWRGAERKRFRRSARWTPWISPGLLVKTSALGSAVGWRWRPLFWGVWRSARCVRAAARDAAGTPKQWPRSSSWSSRSWRRRRWGCWRSWRSRWPAPQRWSCSPWPRRSSSPARLNEK